MAHLHTVRDDDLYFTIDPATRTIHSLSEDPLLMSQGDHNSELFSFEIPRIIEGHDMMECNSVQIHYINLSSDLRTRNSDVYEVRDLQPIEDDPEYLKFTWLVSQNATQHIGTLNFAVRFLCTSGSKVDYTWSTLVFSSIAIAESINNSEVVTEQYSDILMQWYMELLMASDSATGVIDKIEQLESESLAAIDQNKNESLAAIEQNKTDSLAAIDLAETDAINAIADREAEAISKVADNVDELNAKDSDLQSQIDEITGNVKYSSGLTVREDGFGDLGTLFAVYSGTCTDENIVVPPSIDGKTIAAVGISGFEGSDARSITLPNTVVFVAENAFDYCSNLTRLVFGSGVKEIGGAIGNDARLDEFICLAEEPPVVLDDRVFGRGSQPTVYVLPDSVDKYKASEIWSPLDDDIQPLAADEIPLADSLKTLRARIDEVKANGSGANYDDQIANLQSQIDETRTSQTFVNQSLTQTDADLQNQITTNLKNLNNMDANIMTNMKQADDNLQNQITTNLNNLNTMDANIVAVLQQNVQNLSAIDTQLSQAIASEQNKRSAKDDELQAQIDDLKAGSSAYSEGLEYSALSDTECSVYGIGTCTDSNIRIPSTAPGTDDLMVISISTEAFAGNTDITSVTLPETLLQIEQRAFMNCSALKSVLIPDSVTYIDKAAFSGSALEGSLTLNGVQEVIEGAFSDTNITEVVLGSAATTVGAYAFNGCANLKTVTCLNVTAPTTFFENALPDTIETIYVPRDAVEMYKATWGASPELFMYNFIDRIKPFDTLESLRSDIDSLKAIIEGFIDASEVGM